VLEVRDRFKPNGEPIARLFVQRQESYKRDAEDGQMYDASICLSYQMIEPKHSHRPPVSGSFEASYALGFCGGKASVSLVDGALFLDPAELRGQRIGTYLLNEIVLWAQQWPDAKVEPIKILSGQAEDENRARRNRFYERFGLVFAYTDSEQREGVSNSMRVKELTPVMSWETNIRERDPREYLAELLYERKRMVMEASQRDTAIKNLYAELKKARDRPVHWAARQLWWRWSPILLQSALLLVFGTLAWFSFRLK
jgi:GNAT superfamily N-acetyltransferase